MVFWDRQFTPVFPDPQTMQAGYLRLVPPAGGGLSNPVCRRSALTRVPRRPWPSAKNGPYG